MLIKESIKIFSYGYKKYKDMNNLLYISGSQYHILVVI